MSDVMLTLEKRYCRRRSKREVNTILISVWSNWKLCVVIYLMLCSTPHSLGGLMWPLAYLVMDEACRHCLFENNSHIYCKKTTSDVYSPTKDRLDTICESSRKRGDGIHLEIQARSVIYVHRNCASTYCSSQHITRALSETVDKGIPNKRMRRDVDGNFNYKQQCDFCG